VIVRVMGEGQWRVDDSLREELNALDTQALGALERGDEAELDATLERMAELVRTRGEPLPPEDISPSDAIIPPPDLTLEETRELFEGDGLIPDLPAA
jgi:PspA-Associated protein